MKKFTSLFTLLIVLFLMLTIFGSAYLLFLQFIFPTLVPFHGGGETVILDSHNDYTYQIPWEAHSRVHLSLKTNGTVDLYSNSEYLGKCTSYEFILEPNNHMLVTLESDISVSGRFTAWQQIPIEKQALGITILVVGITGLGISTVALKSEKKITERLTL